MTLLIKRKRANPLFFLFLAGILWGCASSSAFRFYSLGDPEVFRVEETRPYTLLVTRFVDRRPVEDMKWEQELKGEKPDLIGALTERFARHLEESGLFRKVLVLQDPVEPVSLVSNRFFIEKGVDLVLGGELAHFRGQAGPEGQIEGRVSFDRLRLMSLRAGEVLWEGGADKELKRREKSPETDFFYASEAFRGAANKVTQQIAALRFPALKGDEVRRARTSGMKLGVLLPGDRRPEEERDIRLRRLKGDPNYTLYSGSTFWGRSMCFFFLKCDEPTRVDLYTLPDRIAEAWAEKLEYAGIFKEIQVIRSSATDPVSLEEWRKMGIGAVLSSDLNHSFGGVSPSSDADWFQIWSGGVATQRKFKAFSVTHINRVRLIDTETGEVLWQGEGELGYEKAYMGWRFPSNFLWKSIHGVLDQMTGEMVVHLRS